MRIFIALDIDDAIRERIARFMEGVRGFAPDARWVRPESLHVTLKFIGEKACGCGRADQADSLLGECRGSAMNVRAYGFFPAPKAARVFWVGIESGPQLAALARAVDGATGTLGIPPEEHPFSPHLTLARAAGWLGRPRLAQEMTAPARVSGSCKRNWRRCLLPSLVP